MRRVVIAVAVSLLLAGCGKHYWNKPGAGLAEFTQDNRECAQQNAVHMTGDQSYGIIARDPYRACLRARGWTRDQKPDPVPAGWFRGFESDDVARLDVPPPQAQAAAPAPPSPFRRCARGTNSQLDSHDPSRCRY